MLMFRPCSSRPVRGAFLAVLAMVPLVACATQPEAAPTPAPAVTSAKQLHQAEAAAYERGFLAGRRYQAKLDGSRPALPCAATPASSTATPASGTAIPAPAELTPAPAAPQPSPLPSSSYAPSGPAQPVTLP